MKRKAVIVFWIIALIVGLTPGVVPGTEIQAEEAPSPGAVYFVAGNGSDSNSGVEAAPFRTLQKARIPSAS